jgi:diguanylate cyclase
MNMKNPRHKMKKSDASIEAKIYVIADEVIDILKQLSQDNKYQLSSKLIAERMFIKDNVKKMLSGNGDDTSAVEVIKTSSDGDRLTELADTILSKFSEIVPSSVSDRFSDLESQIRDNTILEAPANWLNTTMKIVSEYFDSISAKNKELDEFFRLTMQYLAETEKYLSGELSLTQGRFKQDRQFEDDISVNMNMIEKDLDGADNFDLLKSAVLNKIKTINLRIEKKREHDMNLLRNTEKTLSEMTARIKDIKMEAEEIQKRSKEIESESIRDILTGLCNRKAYDEKIRETIANLSRYQVRASLIICDIDFFKKINDGFGHKVGDLAIKKLASLLSENLRKNDFISRYGGDEFAIILPYTTLTDAKSAGEGIRAYIHKSIFSYKEKNIPLTISVGISSFREHDDAGTVFERADKALYLAKNSGRNTVKTEEDIGESST